ncbi:MAG: hypothetical protein ACNS63_09630 [Candidatus Nitrospinota bacterium M3_3B_026]
MQFKRHAFILAIIDSLHKHGSWTGKTHVQKALSLLRDSGKVDLPFEFVLYRHGPYSFDVESELEQMQSYGAVRIEPNVAGYGVVLHPGEMADFVNSIEKLSTEELEAIEDVCEFIGLQPVKVLERLATASWIRCQEGKTEQKDVAERLHSLKPHISIPDAEDANNTVSSWLSQKN